MCGRECGVCDTRVLSVSGAIDQLAHPSYAQPPAPTSDPPYEQVSDYKPYIRLYGDIAINDGYYTVSFESPEGLKTVKARYVFVYKRAAATGKWEIIDHHSSSMPTAPAGLKPATTVAPPK